MQQVRFINNQLILNMFRAYLRSSSGGGTVFYCLLFHVIVVMMLEIRVVRCVHCDEDVACRIPVTCTHLTTRLSSIITTITGNHRQ
jgi:hypothetical protein